MSRFDRPVAKCAVDRADWSLGKGGDLNAKKDDDLEYIWIIAEMLSRVEALDPGNTKRRLDLGSLLAERVMRWLNGNKDS